VFTDTSSRNDRFLIHLLHSNGCSRCIFRGLCLATGLNATTRTNMFHSITLQNSCLCSSTGILFPRIPVRP
jgi:hypothetical protein